MSSAAGADPPILGVDIGTFEAKAVLVTADGSVLARASRRHELLTPRQGHVEHDPEVVWWDGLCAVAHELMNRPEASGGLRAVAVSGIGPCVLPVDEHLRPLRSAILYGVDVRAGRQVEALSVRLGRDEIFRRSGNWLSSQSAGPKIAWLREEEPEVWESARWFLTCQSFLVARLTGEVVIDHATAGYFHPLYDITTNAWDVSGCEDFVDEARLPRLAWSSEIAGTVTAAAWRATGIPAGTPVIVGTADAPAEAVAAGVLDAGSVMAMYGSSGFFIRVGDHLVTDQTLWAAPFVFPGTFVLAAGVATSGTATRWIAEALDIVGETDQETFAALLDLATQAPPGCGGLLALPHFSGERTPFHDPDSRAAFVGLGLAHGRAHLARSVIEGVAHATAAALAAYGAAGAPVKRVAAIGGGTKNDILLRSVSAIAQVTQTVVGSDGAALGDAALAALAVGAVSSREEIARWTAYRHLIEPDPQLRAVLAPDHARFLALYAALSQWRAH